MALPIQRVPRWLGQLLTTFGGQTPQALTDEVHGVLELLQFYGSQQLSNRSATDGALAEAGNITLTVPGNEHWVLFGAQAIVLKTATMTALRGTIQIGPDAANLALLWSEAGGPFGATETGNVRIGKWLPYPRVLGPASLIRFNLDILGTDATASCVLSAQIGVLG